MESDHLPLDDPVHTDNDSSVTITSDLSRCFIEAIDVIEDITR